MPVLFNVNKIMHISIPEVSERIRKQSITKNNMDGGHGSLTVTLQIVIFFFLKYFIGKKQTYINYNYFAIVVLG